MVVGFTEVMVLLAIVAVFFGPGKLPQILGSAGASVKAFKEAARGEDPPNGKHPDE